MPDEHVPTREVAGLAPVDPLIAFFWARLDEREAEYRQGVALYDFDGNGDEAWIEEESKRGLADVAAKKAILDDYARRCADLDNPAREMECQLIRDVIKRLATVYAGHPDYSADFRP
jgi:hypothetical protein